MKRPLGSVLALTAAMLLAATCTDEDEPPAEPTSDDPPPSDEAPDEPAPAPAAPTVVRYDLARHLARAELFHGDARIIDLGAPQGHQHTLGGWRTRTGDTAVLDDVDVSLVDHVTGFYLLPIESTDRCHLSLRARGIADGHVALYVDDETVGNVRVPTDGTFETVQVELPPERCTVGEHDLRVRVPRTGALPGHGSVGLAIDWIRLGTADHAEQGPPATLRDGDALRLPDGWALAWTFEVPPDARLRATLDGDVAVTIERDGQPPTAVEAGADLSRFAGEIVRLRMRADGDATIREPAILVPDPGALRAPRRMRNALVYLTDTLRADHLRVYDPDTRVQTPGLSAWAEHAATFVAGHSQENWTKPSCATLLSGLFPWEHHATSEDAQVPSSVELISERLRDEGLHTGAFVTNGFVSDRFGFRQGWGTWLNYLRQGRRNMARFVADDVEQWLDDRPTDRAFFLYVHTIDPHVPYIPPSDDLALYDPDPYEGPVDFTRDRALLEAVKGGRLRLNARDRVRLEALYDGEVTYHDRHFARMMRALDQRDLADDTIVVFTSDHGEEFWDHDSVGHGHSVWEELIRVPLLIRWPGVTDGAVRIDEAVGLVDVMPTLLEALGLEVPESLSGRSLLPLLRGAVEDAPRPTLTGFMNGWRTVVVGHYKLIQRTPAHWSVYDLESDPGETNDLAPERPIAVRYLRGLLGMGLAEVDRGHEAARTTIDDETRAQLQALGYEGASRAPTDDDSE